VLARRKQKIYCSA